MINMAPDKMGMGYPHKYSFLFLIENIRCGYSLERPGQGAFNENPQHTFSMGNKEYISIICFGKKTPKKTLSGAMDYFKAAFFVPLLKYVHILLLHQCLIVHNYLISHPVHSPPPIQDPL